MAQRRERPAEQHGGKSFDFRLSDGRDLVSDTVRRMPSPRWKAVSDTEAGRRRQSTRGGNGRLRQCARMTPDDDFDLGSRLTIR